ncbi:Crp/Fnr family transcriptional regulator [Flavobacterium sp. SUN052]|uniref:Crp/Fnr family transcriptional regulator n=1 Tax=Flavobacterium sp. SUN052 TaxID=3002441 RepID=UPI00237E530F|nr:Crp/Fnr family transcriptional regulator [Flavobacterium sp. SUN052]MEC4005703.1 Crp/Fnr family transcriptional regulator [Flavobacterium sp. SUN052]
MLDIQKLNYYFGLFKNLELKDFTAIFKLAKIRKIKVSEIYINEGDFYNKIGYIKKGLIRGYFIKENGDEITTIIRWEDQFITSHDGVLFNKPSRLFYQALENTTLIEVDYDVAQTFMAKNPKLEEGRKHFMLKMLAESITRVESFLLLSPEERYLQFIKDKPDIINRIPDKYIATLLGITPVSLSRIKKRIFHKKIL